MSLTVATALDRGQPSELGDLLKAAGIGTCIADLETPTTESGVAVSANVCTLANVPADIVLVYASAGGTVGPKSLVPSGVVPNATQASVNFATGLVTFAAADGVTAATIVYHKASGKVGLATSWPDLR